MGRARLRSRLTLAATAVALFAAGTLSAVLAASGEASPPCWSNSPNRPASCLVSSTSATTTTASTSTQTTTATTTTVASGQGQTFAKTGFESPFTLDARNGSWNQVQYFNGDDAGYDFNVLHYLGDTMRWNTFDIVCSGTGSCPTSGTPGQYVTSSVDTVAGYSGASTRGLRLAFTGNNPNSCCQQVFIQSQPKQSVIDYYVRYRAKLDPDLLATATSLGASYWRAFWEFKAWTDYRILVFIENHNGVGPHWYIQADTTGWNATSVGPVVWTVDSTVPVPLDQWFTFEVYFHRAHDLTGRFYMAVNGQTVADHHGNLYGANSDDVAILAHNILYATQKAARWTLVDDLEVRDFPPCAVLPCGPPS